jgi:hypothetical protein
LGRAGLARHSAGARHVLAELTSTFERATLSATRGAARIFASAEGALEPSLFDAGGQRVACEANVADLELLDDARALVAIDDPRGARLCIRTMESSHDDALDLPAIVRTQWPDRGQRGSIWDEPHFRPEGMALSSHWEFATNAFGTAAVDQQNGVIAVLGPSSRSIDFALRVPVEFPGAEIHAAPTDAGVLVVHRRGRNVGALNHFARDGSHIAGRHVTGRSSAPNVLDARTVMIATEETENYTSRVQLWFIDPSGLSPRELIDTELVATQTYAALHTSHDGRAFIVGDGAKVLAGLRDGTRNWTIRAL